MLLTAVFTPRVLPSTSIHSFLSQRPYLLKCQISSALCNDYIQNVTNTSPPPTLKPSKSVIILLYGCPLLFIQQPEGFSENVIILCHSSIQELLTFSHLTRNKIMMPWNGLLQWSYDPFPLMLLPLWSYFHHVPEAHSTLSTQLLNVSQTHSCFGLWNLLFALRLEHF